MYRVRSGCRVWGAAFLLALWLVHGFQSPTSRRALGLARLGSPLSPLAAAPQWDTQDMGDGATPGSPGKLDFDEDYYKVLEVADDASAAAVKKAYYKMVMRFHPDRTEEDTGKTLANRQMMVINAAYQVLKNATMRRVYDHRRRRGFVGARANVKQSSGSSSSSSSSSGGKGSARAREGDGDGGSGQGRDFSRFPCGFGFGDGSGGDGGDADEADAYARARERYRTIRQRDSDGGARSGQPQRVRQRTDGMVELEYDQDESEGYSGNSNGHARTSSGSGAAAATVDRDQWEYERRRETEREAERDFYRRAMRNQRESGPDIYSSPAAEAAAAAAAAAAVGGRPRSLEGDRLREELYRVADELAQKQRVIANDGVDWGDVTDPVRVDRRLGDLQALQELRIRVDDLSASIAEADRQAAVAGRGAIRGAGGGGGTAAADAAGGAGSGKKSSATARAASFEGRAYAAAIAKTWGVEDDDLWGDHGSWEPKPISGNNSSGGGSSIDRSEDEEGEDKQIASPYSPEQAQTSSWRDSYQARRAPRKATTTAVGGEGAGEGADAGASAGAGADCDTGTGTSTGAKGRGKKWRGLPHGRLGRPGEVSVLERPRPRKKGQTGAGAGSGDKARRGPTNVNADRAESAESAENERCSIEDDRDRDSDDVHDGDGDGDGDIDWDDDDDWNSLLHSMDGE